MKILSIDIGGTHIKFLRNGESTVHKMNSGKKFKPLHMLNAVKSLPKAWSFDVISLGLPAPIQNNQPIAEPHNLGKGWVGFDYEKALGCPVKIINDAAMQAIGSYKGGTMLFLGLGTGIGSTIVHDHHFILPMELGHLPFKKGTFEDDLGASGIKKNGIKKWQKLVFEAVKLFTATILPDYVVLGGGNTKLLKKLPPACFLGDNANAFIGGFRIWENHADRTSTTNNTDQKKARSKIRKK